MTLNTHGVAIDRFCRGERGSMDTLAVSELLRNRMEAQMVIRRDLRPRHSTYSSQSYRQFLCIT